ncbi:hypothetical protein [Glutamicibacter nicotianae]|uniref:hypothetical protein n=1 Tax=Glutamicibacter nicotianae TaxID=37929 RepID=UPI001CBED2CF|nr:hypothetical protein [Glutamicibacter nicotianae]
MSSKYSKKVPSEPATSAQYDHSIHISGPVKGNVDAIVSDNRSYTNITERHNYKVAKPDNSSNDAGDMIAYLFAGFIGIVIVCVLFVVASQYLMLVGAILVGFAFGWSLALGFREFRLGRRPTLSGSLAILRAIVLVIGFVLIWVQVKSAMFKAENIAGIRNQLTSVQNSDGSISKFSSQAELFSDIYGMDGILFVFGLISAVGVSVASMLFVVLDCINHSSYLHGRAGHELSEKGHKRAQIYSERSLAGNIWFTICIAAMGVAGIYVAGHDVFNYLAKLSSVS